LRIGEEARVDFVQQNVEWRPAAPFRSYLQLRQVEGGETVDFHSKDRFEPAQIAVGLRQLGTSIGENKLQRQVAMPFEHIDRQRRGVLASAQRDDVAP